MISTVQTRKLVHQIWLGDSVLECEKFKEGRVDCIVTDPPFGVDNLSRSSVTDHGKKYARKIANDESPEKAIQTFKNVMSVLLPKTSENCDTYIFTSYQVLKDWMFMLDEFMPKFGFAREAVLVWEKNGPGMGDLRIPFGMGVEFIMMYRKGIRELGTFKRRNAVLHYPQVNARRLIHPHEKPVPLLQELVKASTNVGDFVVDPFGGSGSLVRACRQIDRSSVAIEYDRENFDLATKALHEGMSDGFDFGE